MRQGEKALLIGVRDRLRQQCGYTPETCQVEHDEMVPPTTGDLYIAVLSAGFVAGPRHRTSGGIHDFVYAVDVVIVRRITAVPHDRTRDAYLNNFGSLAEESDKVIHAVDFKYPVLDLANACLAGSPESEQPFIEPLKFQSVERRPRIVPGEEFAGTQDKRAGLARTISFIGARRITYQT